MSLAEMRQDKMMDHLLNSLEQGKDIEDYGRLVFTMVARHFLDEDEVVAWLTKNPDFTEDQARALFQQVVDRDYNPPKREKVLDWMERQNFPICPDPDDPDMCNVYRNFEFPDSVYEHIEEYREQKAKAS